MRIIAFWLSLILIFLIPWENVIVLRDIGTISKAVGLLVAVFWILSLLETGRHRKLQWFHLVVFLYFFWHMLSYFWSIDDDMTITRIFTNFQLVVMIVILWDLYTTPAALKSGLQAYVLGAFISIGSIINNYVNNIQGIYQRYSPPGFDSNDIALILALGIPVAWYLAVSEGSGKKSVLLKLVNYAYVPAAVFSILLTASRGGLIAALAAFLFVLGSFTRLSFYQRILIFAALVGTLFSLQSLVPQSSFDRIATIGPSSRASFLLARIDIWRKGLDVFYEHPLVGIGSSAFSTAVRLGEGAHNVFLSILVETGIIGFGLFTVILIIVYYYAKKQPKWESRLWLTVLLVWAIGGMSLSWEHRKQTWLFLSFIVIGANMILPKEKMENVHFENTQQLPK